MGKGRGGVEMNCRGIWENYVERVCSTERRGEESGIRNKSGPTRRGEKRETDMFQNDSRVISDLESDEDKIEAVLTAPSPL